LVKLACKHTLMDAKAYIKSITGPTLFAVDCERGCESMK
jgi:hypothetical protein